MMAVSELLDFSGDPDDVGVPGTAFDVIRILTFHGKRHHLFEAYGAAYGHAAVAKSLGQPNSSRLYEWALEVHFGVVLNFDKR
jgi:hypothetical protein